MARSFRWTGFAGAAEDAAVGALPFVEARECRAQAELLGIAGVDARYERRDKIFENLVAEFPTDELRDRFFLARRFRPFQRFRGHSPARTDPEQRTGQNGLRRHGNLFESSATQHIAWRARVGLFEMIFEADVADQVENRVDPLKTLRACLEQKTVLLNRFDEAPNPVLGFEQDYRDAEREKPVGAGEPGNPPANDDNRCVHGLCDALTGSSRRGAWDPFSAPRGRSRRPWRRCG